MNDGPKMYEALLSVRRFHQQVALLLQTGEGMLAERGFKVIAGSQAVAYYSYAVTGAVSWMPEAAFRWFTVPGHPDLAVDLTVVMCPRTPPSPGVPPFTEPLVTAGWVRFDRPVTDKLEAKWVAWRILWTNVPRDGTWHHNARHAPTAKVGDIESTVMGVPLAEVANSDDLFRKVVEPLLKAIPAAPAVAAAPEPPPAEAEVEPA